MLLHPPKSDDKNGQEMFNRPEVHSEKNTTYKIHTLLLKQEKVKDYPWAESQVN